MFKKWLDSIEEKLGGEEKKKNQLRWILLLGAIGVGAILFSNFFAPSSPNTTTPSPPSVTGNSPINDQSMTMADYEHNYEQQLSLILGQIAGVSDVSVVVNLDSTAEEVVQMDVRDSEQVTTEVDKTGGNRSISQNSTDKKTAYYRTNDGEQPVIVKELKPRVRGVLVVAHGVDNLEVKAAVIEAIERTLEVPAYRISVLPKG